MQEKTKYFVRSLTKKCLAVMTASLNMLSIADAKAPQQNCTDQNDGNNSPIEKKYKRNLKPRLILKLQSRNPDGYILAGHSSHASHSSHSSHSSHYSGRSGGSDDSGGVGLGLGTIVVGGLVAYGAYQLGKRKGKK